MDSAPEHTYRLLDDLPWSDPGKGDAARLHTIRDQLRHLICARLSDQTSSEPVCIGLFGGLGQGKTSAWQQALDCPKQSGQRAARFCVFAATAYPVQMLEQDFDRFIARWTQPHWKKVFWSLCFLAVGIWSVLSKMYLGSFLFAVPLFFILKVLINLGQKDYAALLIREIQRDHRLQQSWLKTLQTWWTRTDVLIIDDLDRLPLDKQRSLLRALYTFRRHLPPITLVAFDEHPLLNSGNDPEAPAELLHKVLDVKLRLPPRMPEDGASLAHDLLAAAADRNPNHLCLRDPVLTSDLATICALMPHISPRLIKLLINNALLHAAQLETPHAEDIGALLKLHALQTLEHQFTADPVALARLLEHDHKDLVKRFGHYLPDLAAHPDKAIWCRFLAQTRGIQPRNGDWHDLIAVHPGARRTTEQGIWSDYASLQAVLVAIRDGYQSQISYVGVRAGEHPTAWCTVWATLRTVCAATPEASGRLRLFRFWQQELRGLQHTVSSDHAKLLQRLVFALYRLWVSDVAVYQVSTDAERDQLIQFSVANTEQGVCLLTQFPPHTLSLSRAIQAITEHTARNPARQWHARTLQRWLRDCVLSDESLPVETSRHCGLLSQCWPPLDRHADLSLSEQFRRQCRLLGALADDQSAVTPRALSQQLWQEGLWATLTHSRYDLHDLAAALDVLCPGPGPGQRHRHRIMTAWLQLLPGLRQADLQSICQPVLEQAHALGQAQREIMFLAIAALDDAVWLQCWLQQYQPASLSLQTARTLLYAAPFHQPAHCLWSQISDEQMTRWFRLDEGADNPLSQDIRATLPELMRSQTQINYLSLLKNAGLAVAW